MFKTMFKTMFKHVQGTWTHFSLLLIAQIQVADAESRSGRGCSHDPGHHGHRWHDGYLLLRGSHSGCLPELLALKNLRHEKD